MTTIREAFPITAKFHDEAALRRGEYASVVEQAQGHLLGLNKAQVLAKAKDAGYYVTSATTKQDAIDDLVAHAWNQSHFKALHKAQEEAAYNELHFALRLSSDVYEAARRVHSEIKSLRGYLDRAENYLNTAGYVDSGSPARHADDLTTAHAKLEALFRLAGYAGNGAEAYEKHIIGVLKSSKNGWTNRGDGNYVYGVQSFIDTLLVPEDAAAKAEAEAQAQAFLDEHVKVIHVSSTSPLVNNRG